MRGELAIGLSELLDKYNEAEDENRKLRQMMKIIAEGYDVRADYDRYVIVKNPAHAPDNGIDPYLVWDCESEREE